jgi:hypothetical protein
MAKTKQESKGEVMFKKEGKQRKRKKNDLCTLISQGSLCY